MVSKKADRLVRESLHKFGLSDEEAGVYIHLWSKGPKTALALSRELRLPRTRVYRILEGLEQQQLVKELVEHRGRRFAPEDPEQLDRFVEEKEHQVQELRLTASFLKQNLNELFKQGDNFSRIIHYKGLEGIEQINWNSTKAKSTLYIFEQIQQLDNWMPHKKAERLREEFHLNGVKVHQIVNTPEIGDYTEVTGHVNDCAVRYLNPDIIGLESDLILYDDVLATYSQNGEDVFCVELHDVLIANIFRQMFEHFWELAQPMKKVSPYGAAKVSTPGV